MGSFALVHDPERIESKINAPLYTSSKSAVTMLTVQYAKAPATPRPISTGTTARTSSSWPSSDTTRPIANRLDVFRYRNMMAAMARAATTSDAFNAIAEPQRRDILALLRAGERPVTDLAQELGMSQPGASKHLRVLREVGLVRVRGAGKQRLYGLDARGLRPVHEWVGGFERFWNESFDRLDTYVQDLKQTRQEE
jgi:DNA-binding transcriptional ArsR family regulator